MERSETMKRIYLPTLEQDERMHTAQQPDECGVNITIFYSDTQSALKLVERQARRLRSAEAQVADLRLALDQEIAIAIDTTPATLSDIVRAAGLSRQSAYDSIERIDVRCQQQQSANAR
jgi:hypothetical protein